MLTWTREQIDWIRGSYSIDPTTGRITHVRKENLRGQFADNIIHKASGYRVMRITCPDMKKRRVLAHRIAWMLYYDVAPPHEIDHVDQDKTNNSKCNLRSATDNQNARNISKRKQHGERQCHSQYKGVTRNRKRWRAYIHVDGKQISLDRFDTELEAAVRYNVEALRLHGEFASLNVLP